MASEHAKRVRVEFERLLGDVVAPSDPPARAPTDPPVSPPVVTHPQQLLPRTPAHVTASVDASAAARDVVVATERGASCDAVATPLVTLRQTTPVAADDSFRSYNCSMCKATFRVVAINPNASKEVQYSNWRRVHTHEHGQSNYLHFSLLYNTTEFNLGTVCPLPSPPAVVAPTLDARVDTADPLVPRAGRCITVRDAPRRSIARGAQDCLQLFQPQRRVVEAAAGRRCGAPVQVQHVPRARQEWWRLHDWQREQRVAGQEEARHRARSDSRPDQQQVAAPSLPGRRAGLTRRWKRGEKRNGTGMGKTGGTEEGRRTDKGFGEGDDANRMGAKKMDDRRVRAARGEGWC